MNKRSVARLIEAGYRIDVTHNRCLDEKGGPLPRGGNCEVRVTTPDGKVLTGYSYCASCDNYNKKVARNIAVGRAIKQI